MNTDHSLDIVYEDEHYLLASKPWGMHSDSLSTDPDDKPTVANTLSTTYPQALLLNRLDFHTSGLIIAAKSDESAMSFKALQAAGGVEKSYYALVEGKFFGEEACEAYIGTPYRRAKKVRTYDKKPGSKHRALEACTHFKSLALFEDLNSSLVNASLLIGRRHQIRVHASHLGFPLVGDELYGATTQVKTLLKLEENPEFLLHAFQVRFVCPQSKQRISCKIKPPKYFELGGRAASLFAE